jgi:hypothetical protein
MVTDDGRVSGESLRPLYLLPARERVFCRRNNHCNLANPMTANRANTRKHKSTKRTLNRKSGRRDSSIATNSKPTYSVRYAIFQDYEFNDYPASEYQRKYAD